MEDNLGQAIEIAFMVFLFVFAVSSAMISYNRLSQASDSFITINIENRRGNAANDRLKSQQDIMRKADYAEIVMSILNLPNTVMTNVNGETIDYKIIVKRKSGNTYVIRAANTANYLEYATSYFPPSIKYYVSYTEDSVIYTEIQ